MKTTFYKSSLIALMAGVALTSCVNDDDYGVPEMGCIETNLVANKDPQDIVATSTVQLYEENDVIEAYVVSSDEGGNFFKSISLQTLDGSFGFSVPVDATSTFINFEPGRKVFIKLQNQYVDMYNGSLRIGSIFVDSDGDAMVGRIPEAQYTSVLNRSCTVVSEEDLVKELTIEEALSDEHLNTLIDLQNVQFTEAALGNNYYDADNVVGGATNHYLTDAEGNTIIFRTSSFASFAGSPVDPDNGTVRGVLTKFGSDYQFMARTEDDIMLTEDRMDIDLAAPIVGESITFGLFNENFESYAANNRNFPNAVNDPVEGTRYWEVKAFGGNKYIQMTSFGGTAEANRSLYIIPVDFTTASSISFETKAGYDNGSVLKVYYSNDYIPGSDVNTATLVDITSEFTIPSGPSNGYATNFTNSGAYNFTETGNGFIIFEYVGNGNGGPTTTMQIDNIVVN